MKFKSLAIEQKIGQLFFIGIPGPELDGATQKLLAEISPGGVCMFARNIKNALQTRDLLDGICKTLPVEPFLSLDQEGGLVDRLRRIMTPMPAANKIDTAEQSHRLGSIIGEAVALLGFNMDFAPVVDVLDDVRARFSNGLNSRAFGKSKEIVIEFASAFLVGLESHGILGCLKHFPGLGAAEVDSHEELPLVSISDDELRSNDLIPYLELFSRHHNVSAMVAHAAFPNTRLQETDQSGKLLPSSLSFNIVTKLLREEIGFTGIAITDDLEMGAILKNYGIGEACKMAINAGEDMLAICAGVDAVNKGFIAVLDAVNSGEIPVHRIDKSLERIAALKSKLSPRIPMDSARLMQLSEQIGHLNSRLN